MSANDSGVPGERHKQGKGGPAVVMPSTRVTIAFPFSTIKVTEADDRLKKLAAIVAELADQPAALDPTPAAQDVLTRARSCASDFASGPDSRAVE